MSTDPDNNAADYADQLAQLASRLQSHAGDEAMLAEVGVAIRSLLSGNGDNENHIRAMLQGQFDAGHLRKETYELVQNLLGKIVTEELARGPLPASSSMADELFVETAVIEDQAQAQMDAQAQEKVAPDVQLQVGSILRDRFLLKHEVSEGSMGVVYKALDRRLAEAGEKDANVAIKILSPQLSRNGAALRALQQEAAKGRCLTHPNIVRFVDLDREGDLYFIVMEWLDGRSLSSILDDNHSKVIDLPTAMDIVRQCAVALDYAHQRGVVHADVKPGNIIITPEGQVKLIDFGVARVRQKENEGKSRFDPAVLRAGTPAYSSMQVLTGEDPVPADDVFSLACLAYRLIAGYRVFGPRNAAQAAEDGMEPQRPQGISDGQWQSLKKALSYSRVTRFASAGEFVKALGIRDGKAAPTATFAAKAASPSAHVPDEPVLHTQTRKIPAPEIEAELQFKRTVRLENPMPTPIRADKESIMYEPDDDDDEDRRSPWRLIVIGVIIIASAAVVVTRTDLVDQIGRTVETIDVSPVASVFESKPEIVDAPPIDEAAQDVAVFNEKNDGIESEVDRGQAEEAAASIVEDAPAVDVSETLVPGEFVEQLTPQEPSIDYSALPPASLTINLAADAEVPSVADLTLREGGDSAILDIFREDTADARTVKISEVGFRGNQSARLARRYTIDNDGVIEFAAGQERARFKIALRSNTIREPDREIVLQITDAVAPAESLARINLVLEDDDQRAFEAALPINTVTFTANRISVRESDPAAQIDVLRYNPDGAALEVGYSLIDATATEGQDYFTPGSTTIYFSAGQRSARILVPLGQDAKIESDETFRLEFENGSVVSDSNIFSQITVMIRDDDS